MLIRLFHYVFLGFSLLLANPLFAFESQIHEECAVWIKMLVVSDSDLRESMSDILDNVFNEVDSISTLCMIKQGKMNEIPASHSKELVYFVERINELKVGAGTREYKPYQICASQGNEICMLKYGLTLIKTGDRNDYDAGMIYLFEAKKREFPGADFALAMSFSLYAAEPSSELIKVFIKEAKAKGDSRVEFFETKGHPSRD